MPTNTHAAILFISALVANLNQAQAFVPLSITGASKTGASPSATALVPSTAFSRTSANTINPRLFALFSTPGDDEQAQDDGIDISEDDRLYRIRLPRAPGIEWGTDLSFSFVYVREMDPSGPASMSNMVSKGDQICELRPVEKDGKVVPLIGASFDAVMGAFASLKKTTTDVELVLFKGTKDELKALCTGKSETDEEVGKIKITVIQNKGSKDEKTRVILADEGANVRQTLVDEGINVYQSVTRWTNCKGKQLCGTCIVNMADGAWNTNRKSMDEESTLRENPDTYRLSCVTFAYGDVTVETFPPINAAQWTR